MTQFAPIDFQGELNEAQYEAVTAPDGPALVLAGAGSGKTRTLTYRVAFLLSRGVRPWEILLLTFTNKAAREMLSRVEDLTGYPGRQFWGGTFHSIGQRILRRSGPLVGLEPNFTILDQGDAESLLGEVIRNTDPAYLKNKEHPKAKVLADVISYARNTRSEVGATVRGRYPWFAELEERVVAFARAYEAAKRERQLADYDDLLELWLRVLEEDAEAREHYQQRFRHILVDEYQDTNKLQGRLVMLLGEKHRNVMVVGDNWQCIYTWRGAEFSNMEDFHEAFPERRIHKIETNYRSSPEILRFANALMLAHPPIPGYPLELQPVNEPNQRPYFIPVMDTRLQANLVCQRIAGLINEGRSLRDIVVLYRAHYHAMDLQMELSRQGFSYTITSGVRFFEQAHVRDLVAMLRFASNPQDTVAFTRFCGLLPKIGPKTAERLYKLAEQTAAAEALSTIGALTHEAVTAKVPAGARDDWRDMALTMQDIEEQLRGPVAGRTQTTDTEGGTPGDGQGDLFADVKEARRAKNAPPREKSDALEPAPPEDIVRIAVEGWYGDYLRNLHSNWQSRKEDLESLIGFAARYGDMTELLAQLVLLNSETSDRSADLGDDALRLTTIHQAKGLEFPVVFVIGMSDGLFPLKRAIEEGDLDEERRLFYVAVTRAEEELYLVHPRVAQQGGPPSLMNPSRFVAEMPEDTFEVLRAPGSPY